MGSLGSCQLRIGLRDVSQRSPTRIVREQKPPLSIDRAQPFTGKSYKECSVESQKRPSGNLALCIRAVGRE